MSEENDNTSSGCFNTLGYIFILCIVVIPGIIGLSSSFLENNPEIAQSVKDLGSGISMNSVVGDYRIYKYGEDISETISCNVKDRDIIFSGKAIDDNDQALFDMLSSTRFTLTSKEPMIFEGNVLDKRESKRIKTRLTFDGESRLIISSWDDDSGKWKKWTGNLYFEKF